MNNFKIPHQKHSTNMATGSYVTSRENDLLELFPSFFLWANGKHKKCFKRHMMPPTHSSVNKPLQAIPNQ